MGSIGKGTSTPSIITSNERLLVDKYFENYSDTDFKQIRDFGHGRITFEMKDFNGKFEIVGSQRKITKIITDMIYDNNTREGNKRVFNDDEYSIYIQYKDGSDRYISEGAVTSNLKLTGIKSVHITNPESDMLYGEFSISKLEDGQYYAHIK